MHALLLAADPRTVAGLAAAWRAGGAGTVETAVLPAPAPPGAPPRGHGPAAPAPGPAPVLVPLAVLLRRPEPGGGPSAPPAWAARIAAADLVVVHLERLDALALHGPPLGDVVAAAVPAAVPVVVLAGRDETTRREWSAAGLSGVHEVGAVPDGPPPDGTADAAGARADRVARAAATWAPRWREASPGGRAVPPGGSRA